MIDFLMAVHIILDKGRNQTITMFIRVQVLKNGPSENMNTISHPFKFKVVFLKLYSVHS